MSTELSILRSITVFCGAKPGREGAQYRPDAFEAGEYIAQQGWRLVYGGGSNGLMGEVANGALHRKGQVLGIITQHLVDKEVAHRGLTDLRIVPEMAIRKTRLIEQGDAFLILPGGMGTLDELFEVITLAQLGISIKPIVVYNPDGFFDHLQRFIEHLVQEGFVHQADWSRVQFYGQLRHALAALKFD